MSGLSVSWLLGPPRADKRARRPEVTHLLELVARVEDDGWEKNVEEDSALERDHILYHLARAESHEQAHTHPCMNTPSPRQSTLLGRAGRRRTCEERNNRFVNTTDAPDFKVVGDPEGQDEQEENLTDGKMG